MAIQKRVQGKSNAHKYIYIYKDIIYNFVSLLWSQKRWTPMRRRFDCPFGSFSNVYIFFQKKSTDIPLGVFCVSSSSSSSKFLAGQLKKYQKSRGQARLF